MQPAACSIDCKRTLSGKLIAFGFFEKPSLDRGIPSGPRLKPTRFAADATQLPLARAFAEEVSGVVAVPAELEGLALTCLAEETVGDMKRGGGAFLACFSLGGLSIRGW